MDFEWLKLYAESKALSHLFFKRGSHKMCLCR